MTFSTLSLDYGFYLHKILEAAGFIIGFAYYRFLRQSYGNDPISRNHRSYLIFAAAVGAFCGSRIAFFWETPTVELSAVLTGKTITGGILGATFFVELLKKFLKITHSSGDLFCFPLLVGMIIGRIGCFLAGVHDKTYGLPSNLPWAINFGDGVLRHPSQLYEIGALFLFFIIFRKNVLPSGYLFRFFALYYFSLRLILDMYKPLHKLPYLEISSTQLFSLIGIGYFSCLFFLPKQVQQT